MRVPEDLSATGFEDAPEADRPRGLTTIRHPMVHKGQLAAQLLFTLLRGDPKPDNVNPPTELVQRSTSGPRR